MPPHPAHHQAGQRYAPNLPNQQPAGPGRVREGAKSAKQLELDALPSMDSNAYYDPPSSPSSSSISGFDSPPASPHDLRTNSGNKLISSARWIRRGKMWAWGPSYEDAKSDQLVRKRLKLCLEQFLPDAAADVGVAPPSNIVEEEAKRKSRKRKRAEDKEFVLPHLTSPSPPLSTTRLAPMLAIPQSYLEIMTSPSMRHSLGDDGMESGLQRTAAELLEGEKGLMQALGRLREVLRVRGRDVPEGLSVEPPPPVPATSLNGNHLGLNGHVDEPVKAEGLPSQTPAAEGPLIPALPHVSDTDNLWRVAQEILSNPQPPPTITFTVTPAGAAVPSSSSIIPTLTPVHRLFTCPTGITFNAIPNPLHPGFNYPSDSLIYPEHVKYNLDLPNQQRAVDDALERISELLADCNEYKERLEEARDRVADVARARKKVWSVVKERAGWELDREK
ncbi:hypothetical protein P7C73_g3366, partial [Tremellales sp. Uapishka_1]